MKSNIGGWDKALRIIIGSLLVIAGAYLKSMWGLIGMIPIITAFTGVCPLYLLFRLNTSGKK